MRNTLTKVGATLFGAVATLFVLAGAAGAEPPPADPTNGAYSDGIADVQSFVTGTAAGPLFLLAAAVVGIMVGLRWLKKSKTAAG